MFSCTRKSIIMTVAVATLAVLIIVTIVGVVAHNKHKSDEEKAIKLMLQNYTTVCDLSENSNVAACSKQIQVVSINSTTERQSFAIPDENDIAISSHFGSVAPMNYNWTMKFPTKETFEGKVVITIAVVKDTSRVFINAHSKALNIDYQSVSVRSCASAEHVCVEKVTVAEDDQVLIIDFDRPLKKGFYALEFGSFSGQIFKQNLGSEGLRLTDSSSTYWAITTIFQMRQARTVLPCFDHPALKSTFVTCIEHSADSDAFSNTPIERVQQLKETNRVLECFQKTPRIPIYVATVALTGSFMKTVDDASLPVIEVYHSKNDNPSLYAWEVTQSRQLFELFNMTFGLQYNLTKLGLMNVNPSPFWGVENIGLITLESGFTRFSDSDRGKEILVHEIIHQWLGNVATISKWSEICLQEGLTAYLEMAISAKMKYTDVSLNQQMRTIIAEYMGKDHTSPIIQMYNVTQDIADHCFGKPTVVLNMIASGFGEQVWTTFFKKLVTKFAYANANLEDWVHLLSEVTGSPEAGNALRQWFTEPGYPIIYAEVTSDNEVSLKQKIYVNEHTLNKTKPSVPPTARLTPIRLANEVETSAVFLQKSVQQTVKFNGSSWLLVDPDSDTFTRKVYSSKNYLALLNCHFGDNKNCPINADQIGATFNDFCFALMEDQFPWATDDTNDVKSAAETWTSILTLLHGLTSNSMGRKKLNLPHMCECCLKTKDELTNEKFASWHPNACKATWNERCRNMNLMKTLGRDYTV